MSQPTPICRDAPTTSGWQSVRNALGKAASFTKDKVIAATKGLFQNGGTAAVGAVAGSPWGPVGTAVGATIGSVGVPGIKWIAARVVQSQAPSVAKSIRTTLFGEAPPEKENVLHLLSGAPTPPLKELKTKLDRLLSAINLEENPSTERFRQELISNSTLRQILPLLPSDQKQNIESFLQGTQLPFGEIGLQLQLQNIWEMLDVTIITREKGLAGLLVKQGRETLTEWAARTPHPLLAEARESIRALEKAQISPEEKAQEQERLRKTIGSILNSNYLELGIDVIRAKALVRFLRNENDQLKHVKFVIENAFCSQAGPVALVQTAAQESVENAVEKVTQAIEAAPGKLFAKVKAFVFPTPRPVLDAGAGVIDVTEKDALSAMDYLCLTWRGASYLMWGATTAEDQVEAEKALRTVLPGVLDKMQKAAPLLPPPLREKVEQQILPRLQDALKTEDRNIKQVWADCHEELGRVHFSIGKGLIPLPIGGHVHKPPAAPELPGPSTATPQPASLSFEQEKTLCLQKVSLLVKNLGSQLVMQKIYEGICGVKFEDAVSRENFYKMLQDKAFADLITPLKSTTTVLDNNEWEKRLKASRKKLENAFFGELDKAKIFRVRRWFAKLSFKIATRLQEFFLMRFAKRTVALFKEYVTGGKSEELKTQLIDHLLSFAERLKQNYEIIEKELAVPQGERPLPGTREEKLHELAERAGFNRSPGSTVCYTAQSLFKAMDTTIAERCSPDLGWTSDIKASFEALQNKTTSSPAKLALMVCSSLFRVLVFIPQAIGNVILRKIIKWLIVKNNVTKTVLDKTEAAIQGKDEEAPSSLLYAIHDQLILLHNHLLTHPEPSTSSTSSEKLHDLGGVVLDIINKEADPANKPSPLDKLIDTWVLPSLTHSAANIFASTLQSYVKDSGKRIKSISDLLSVVNRSFTGVAEADNRTGTAAARQDISRLLNDIVRLTLEQAMQQRATLSKESKESEKIIETLRQAPLQFAEQAKDTLQKLHPETALEQINRLRRGCGELHNLGEELQGRVKAATTLRQEISEQLKIYLTSYLDRITVPLSRNLDEIKGGIEDEKYLLLFRQQWTENLTLLERIQPDSSRENLLDILSQVKDDETRSLRTQIEALVSIKTILDTLESLNEPIAHYIDLRINNSDRKTIASASKKIRETIAKLPEPIQKVLSEAFKKLTSCKTTDELAQKQASYGEANKGIKQAALASYKEALETIQETQRATRAGIESVTCTIESIQRKIGAKITEALATIEFIPEWSHSLKKIDFVDIQLLGLPDLIIKLGGRLVGTRLNKFAESLVGLIQRPYLYRFLISSFFPPFIEKFRKVED